MHLPGWKVRRSPRPRRLAAGVAVMLAAAGALAAPASAQAATLNPAAAASTSCPNPVNIQNKATADWAYIPSNGILSFSAALYSNGGDFCIVWHPISDYQTIYTSQYASGDCLAWSSAAYDIYNHNPNGCGTSASYMDWATLSASGSTVMLQNLDTGLCVYDYGYLEIAACNPNSQADSFYLDSY